MCRPLSTNNDLHVYHFASKPQTKGNFTGSKVLEFQYRRLGVDRIQPKGRSLKQKSTITNSKLNVRFENKLTFTFSTNDS